MKQYIACCNGTRCDDDWSGARALRRDQSSSPANQTFRTIKDSFATDVGIAPSVRLVAMRWIDAETCSLPDSASGVASPEQNPIQCHC